MKFLNPLPSHSIFFSFHIVTAITDVEVSEWVRERNGRNFMCVYTFFWGVLLLLRQLLFPHSLDVIDDELNVREILRKLHMWIKCIYEKRISRVETKWRIFVTFTIHLMFFRTYLSLESCWKILWRHHAAHIFDNWLKMHTHNCRLEFLKSQ